MQQLKPVLVSSASLLRSKSPLRKITRWTATVYTENSGDRHLDKRCTLDRSKKVIPVSLLLTLGQPSNSPVMVLVCSSGVLRKKRI